MIFLVCTLLSPSYSDFHALSSGNSVTWPSVHLYVLEKYERLSKEGDEVAVKFFKSLNEHRANLTGKFSILVAPGFWEKMDMKDATKLAQSIFQYSNFKVFVIVAGHKFSNAANARELNPHITGRGLDTEVLSRHFCTTPVVSASMWDRICVLIWTIMFVIFSSLR